MPRPLRLVMILTLRLYHEGIFLPIANTELDEPASSLPSSSSFGMVITEEVLSVRMSVMPFRLES